MVPASILTKKKSYDSIIAPLKKILSDLSNHVTQQNKNIETLNVKKSEIDNQITDSETEIRKSTTTIEKLKDLVVTE